jgi:hypothetical protein
MKELFEHFGQPTFQGFRCFLAEKDSFKPISEQKP